MCGINGFNWKDEKLIQEMNGATSHRGPDATGTFCGDAVSLGHNRLSIIDLSAEANQPMKDNSGKLTIILNGEIYNFKELKNELEKEYKFKTKSDTEVILASYKKWGEGSFAKLNGMFAFALWDDDKKSLYLVRDPAGIKPLFYFFNGEKLIFSSEIKAILKHKNVPRNLDKESLNSFFRVLYTPSPKIGFRAINKLPAGHFGTLKDGQFSINSYWSWPEPEAGFVPSDEVIKSQVLEAVKRQLVSDRPVGIYLSGGLDSTSVLHSMVHAGQKVESFSVGFDLPNKEEEEKFNHDFSLARRVSEIYGTSHNELRITTKDVAENLEKVLAHLDDPISNPTAIPMALLSKFTKPKATVVLSGDGGDELFGGYDRYRLAKVSALAQNLPAFFENLAPNERFKKLFTKSGIDQFSLFMFQEESGVKRIMNKDLFVGEEEIKEYFKSLFTDSSLGAIDQLMRADFQSWLPDQALALADKMSMMSAVEQRVPLLDLELAKLMMRVSADKKVGYFENKKLLRKAFRKELPDFLFNQPKRGWFAPGAKWLRNPEILKIVRECLSESYNKETTGLFNWSEVENMLEAHISKRTYNANLLWAILTFQIWAKKYEVISSLE